jgi:hypothetical protein
MNVFDGDNDDPMMNNEDDKETDEVDEGMPVEGLDDDLADSGDSMDETDDA